MKAQLALLLALAMAPAGHGPRQAPAGGAVPFDSGWTLEGDRTRIVRQGGKDVLQVETGLGHRRDVKLLDGTLDVDVQVTDRRSFVYIHFRVESPGEREEFYLRPHKSALPDAVQYAPVWQNRSAWQLHHGPGGTAAVPLPDDRPMRVRVVVQGTRAALFVEDMTTPALLVPHLSREPRSGSVSLGGFLPGGVPGDGPIATFSNVRIRPGVVDYNFAATKPDAALVPPPEPVTLVDEWAVSQAFVPKPGSGDVLPGDDMARAFKAIPAEPDGLVQLHRHITVPESNRVATSVARIKVRAPRTATYAFDLGFSDIATVFVNGTPVFRGDASYSFDRPRREGLIGFDQARLYLPLRAGENDVSILLSDSFGGWGIMGRFVGTSGVSTSAR